MNTALIPISLEVAAEEKSFIEVYGNDYEINDGTGVRDFIHVVDLVNAHILGINQQHKNKNGICNLGNGQGFSVNEMIEVARKVTKKYSYKGITTA